MGTELSLPYDKGRFGGVVVFALGVPAEQGFRGWVTQMVAANSRLFKVRDHNTPKTYSAT